MIELSEVTMVDSWRPDCRVFARPFTVPYASHTIRHACHWLAPT